tara:strand:- start:58 stop:273 length:216 start_codon:yes stop_codon:yes gene_type:complete
MIGVSVEARGALVNKTASNQILATVKDRKLTQVPFSLAFIAKKRNLLAGRIKVKTTARADTWRSPSIATWP